MQVKAKSGKFTGTGAAVNVSLGFKPLLVMLQNSTDGDMIAIYIDDDAGADPTGSTDADATAGFVTDAGGITYYAGDLSNPPGFSVDAGNSESGKVIRYIAFGAD